VTVRASLSGYLKQDAFQMELFIIGSLSYQLLVPVVGLTPNLEESPLKRLVRAAGFEPATPTV
jgi:hypothetical protein